MIMMLPTMSHPTVRRSAPLRLGGVGDRLAGLAGHPAVHRPAPYPAVQRPAPLRPRARLCDGRGSRVTRPMIGRLHCGMSLMLVVLGFTFGHPADYRPAPLQQPRLPGQDRPRRLIRPSVGSIAAGQRPRCGSTRDPGHPAISGRLHCGLWEAGACGRDCAEVVRPSIDRLHCSRIAACRASHRRVVHLADHRPGPLRCRLLKDSVIRPIIGRPHCGNGW
jgi:hypothetical protein